MASTREQLQGFGWRKVPTPAETRELFEQLGAARTAGDEAGVIRVRNELVERNMPLVVSVAVKHAKLGRDIDDMIHQGATGLMRAVEKFEPARGLMFSTYAIRWILQRILRGFEAEAMVRVPRSSRAQCNRSRKSTTRSATRQRLMDDVAKAIARKTEGLYGEDGKLRALEARVANSLDFDLQEDLVGAIGQLDPREAQVIRRRFFDGWQLEQVGWEIGVSRQRVKQIESDALIRLRALLRNHRNDLD